MKTLIGNISSFEQIEPDDKTLPAIGVLALQDDDGHQRIAFGLALALNRVLKDLWPYGFQGHRAKVRLEGHQIVTLEPQL